MPFAIISGVHESNRRYIRDNLQLLFADMLGYEKEQTTVTFLDDSSAPEDQRVVAQVCSKRFSTMTPAELGRLADGIVGVLEMNANPFNEVLFITALHVLARQNSQAE
jgi:hypothetical protein